MKNIDFIGFVLDKEGSAKEIAFNEIDNYKKHDNLLWLHFNYTKAEAIEWISTKSGIDNIAVDALLVDETRPRTIVLGDNLLLALRGVNLDPNSKPEDMKSIRLYISENMIISTSRRTILSVIEMIDELKKGVGIKSPSEFLVELTYKMIDRIDSVIDKIHDRSDLLEDSILESIKKNQRVEILNIRREIIILKRYLSPQKEALIKLYNEKISWLNEYQKIELRETNDQLIRHIEELDTIRDKIMLIQDELVNNLSQELNSKMYIMAIISAIFLPLTFLTGLLGINVGGIPGAENENAFYIFTIVLLFVVTFQFFIFKKSKWI
ncbi:zinc transporter ZntB [Aliarcobacter cibarius]|jgi:zinc transporter|uniref:Zinc transporter (EcCorA_ZntB-like family) n=1 Tax=Aliarcobacter cibarius TaxID=255507 RepID=A0A5J6RDV2_9BACT|nr:zinc transporter ZntB [Aliarcobacter cibarius]QEZ88250.1 zinc transporter (EcCorA_ZntB-like family) [Aliarcobacter cibarius]QKJ26046.1 zinc transporter (EcCorA_ZntB-like family) [Aliarcobacter cibarius]TLT00211.1 zinc transporter ZntB [Aliarcobacter cibarius]TLT00610.1 zinc transporter ZntB [Aliarcobacter cibarius]TLT05117.1 zinc transporter ZntB [Aliarcobacter cibarius]